MGGEGRGTITESQIIEIFLFVCNLVNIVGISPKSIAFKQGITKASLRAGTLSIILECWLFSIVLECPLSSIIVECWLFSIVLECPLSSIILTKWFHLWHLSTITSSSSSSTNNRHIIFYYCEVQIIPFLMYWFGLWWPLNHSAKLQGKVKV